MKDESVSFGLIFFCRVPSSYVAKKSKKFSESCFEIFK